MKVNYVIYGLALIGAYVLIDKIIKHIKFKIGVHRYYKQLYKDFPDKHPKNQK